VAQDHKRIFDGDKGPNTGGMGAYAPAPLVDDMLLARIDGEIIRPTLDAMKKEGVPYTGLLYAGIMMTDEGPRWWSSTAVLAIRRRRLCCRLLKPTGSLF